MADQEEDLMTLSTKISPVYGGNLYIVFSDDVSFPLDAELYLVFEGSRQRHVTSCDLVNEHTLHSRIPAHAKPESVELTIYRVVQRSCHFIASVPFYYQYDTAYFMVQFLLDSVYNTQSLDNLELVRSDRFDLANEERTTLDERLVLAFRYIPFPVGWNILGYEPDIKQVERETLLHFTARLGLFQVALFLLAKPGSHICVQLLNKEGYTPADLAAKNGFQELVELLSRYNTNGMVTNTDQQISTQHGLIQSHENGSTTLSTYIDSPSLRPVEEDIDMLQSVHNSMKRSDSDNTQQYRSSWPDTPKKSQQPDCNMVCNNNNMEEAIDRLFKERQSHQKLLESVCGPQLFTVNKTLSAKNVRSNGNSYNHINSNNLQSDDNRGEITGDAGQWGILEGSLNSLRGISNELLKLRDARSLDSTLGQDLRKDSLARFSTSCPALDVEGRESPSASIDEADHHKSMLDLAEDSQQNEGLDVETTQYHNRNFLSPNLSTDTVDPNIRICINGVTVDSSTDYADQLQGDNYSDGYLNSTYSSNEVNGNCPRRRSWCPNNNNLEDSDQTNRQTSRARMLALTGKSMSLNSLDGADDDSEEDYQDAREQATPSLSRIKLGTSVDKQRKSDNTATTYYDRSFSPAIVTGSSPPAKDMPDASSYYNPIVSEGAVSGPSVRSYPDPPLRADSMKEETHKDIAFRTYSVEATKTVRSYDEEDSSLSVPHSNMTKSLSTPSIPAAAAAANDNVISSDDRKRSLRREPNREGKHALFRRQQEVEEYDDESVVPQTSKKSSMSLRDFLNEDVKSRTHRSPSPDSDDKSKPKKEEDRKKRKTSVFSRISYRNKKKEKENKIKTTHQFVSVCFGNNTACDVCHKTMANKPAIRCENCLINVHENNCKDQMLPCDKYRMVKVIPRDGQTGGQALIERQTVSVQGSGLRPSHSFKDKRSVSAPVRTPAPSTAPFIPHRHSLPSNSVYGSPPSYSSLYSQLSTTSSSLLHKAINEESETDSMGPGHDIGPSNINDTISESMESLVEPVLSEKDVLDDEPDLLLSVSDPEAWSVSVDRKTVKKMGTKDIKRQDHIWELIITEKQYCRTLKIMQKVFSHGLLNELHFAPEVVERLFPKLDDLIDIHTKFLRQLLQLQKKRTDRLIEEIGPTLLEMFSGATAVKMKKAYGCFCSKHKESVALYKDYLKTERKFHSFFRKCSELPMVKKREFPDFMLGVTLRLSKYPLLIEAIQNSTKDKKDREKTREAHESSRNVNYEVDQDVASYEKLVEVQKNIDSRATTVFKGKKFKRQDITAGDRRFVYSGIVGWKNARGRVTDILAVVLTDIIIFLQENNQKYTFYVQDNKSCVVSLYKLLVREKNDSRDSHGIYLICQNKHQPEMYELVCKSKASKDDWTESLKRAVEKCPQEEEVPIVVSLENEADRTRKEERAAKIQYIIEQLHQKDRDIKDCCEEKNQLMVELLDITNSREDSHSRPNSQDYSRGSQSLEVLQAAILEASRLTTILQGSGTHLSRSVSSVGEHVSHSYVAMPMPKRAETFAGFDSSYEVPKGAVKKRFVPQIRDSSCRTPSLLSLDKQDADASISSVAEQTGGHKESTDSRSPAQLGQSPKQKNFEDEGVRPSDRLSDLGSFGELSGSSISSLGHTLGRHNQEEMSSITQLCRYLHCLMSLTSEHSTAVEDLRAQLITANEKINKLSVDVSEKKSVYHHNQLEELRNLQENYSRERQEWERTRSQNTVWLESETSKLEEQRRVLARKEDELRRQREALQKQIDMLKEVGLPLSSSFSGNQPVCEHPDSPDSRQNNEPVVHKRSASADFYKGTSEDLERLNQYNQRDNAGEFRGNGSKPRLSMGNLPSYNSVGQKQTMPVHLLSTTNEQKVGSIKGQQIPMKLVGNPTPHGTALHQQKPSLLKGTISNPAHQRQGLHHGPTGHSAPSNLALVKRLAEPHHGTKNKTPSPQGSTHSAPGGNKQGKSDEVIYF
ncbi:rho guanine nucleotide exchange factor 28 isoform X3 [Patella vulgata]|uniref:rho guanine nucleotide exchange factor 28 isoform X3 n=1 Tax=Patella vulgata TaxID=6465 RepID=UPI0024A85122|nr:rho guanine nucleotide exchange factor 28 isoform X3 [Patella vulgata]